MKIKQILFHITLIFLLLFIPIYSNNAQVVDSASIFFIESVDEARVIISQTREDLYQSLRRRNLEKTNSLIIKSIELNSEPFEIFYSNEKNLVNLILCDFNSVIDDIKSGNDFLNDSVDYNVEPKYSLLSEYSDDNLMTDLIDLCSDDAELIRNKIEGNTAIDAEEKDLLQLYFNAILAHTNLEAFPKDTITHYSEQFYNTYPGSIYNPYITRYINYEYKTSAFGFGFGLYSGYHIFTDSLQVKFGHSVPIGGSLSVSYKRFLFDLNFAGSIGAKTLEAFTYDDKYWKKDLSVSISTGELNLGYSVIDNKRIKATPYVGLYNTSISINNYDPEIDSIESSIKYFPSYNFGVSLDYKIGYFNKVISSYRDKFMAEKEKTYWCVHFRIGYNDPMLDKKDKQFSGSNIYFDLGLGFYTNPAKRIIRYK